MEFKRLVILINCRHHQMRSLIAWDARILKANDSAPTHVVMKPLSTFLTVSPPSVVTGLPSHPQYDVVKRQCTGCPGMITFYIKGKLHHATTFLSSLRVISHNIFL